MVAKGSRQPAPSARQIGLSHPLQPSHLWPPNQEWQGSELQRVPKTVSVQSTFLSLCGSSFSSPLPPVRVIVVSGSWVVFIALDTFSGQCILPQYLSTCLHMCICVRNSVFVCTCACKYVHLALAPQYFSVLSVLHTCICVLDSVYVRQCKLVCVNILCMCPTSFFARIKQPSHAFGIFYILCMCDWHLYIWVCTWIRRTWTYVRCIRWEVTNKLELSILMFRLMFLMINVYTVS